MNRHQSRPVYGTRIAAAGILTFLALPGCGGGSSPAQPTTTLSAADFNGPAQTPAGENAPGSTQGPTATDRIAERQAQGYAVTVTGPVAARTGVFDVVATTGEPVPVQDAAAVEKPVLIDAKVGDINGRPVFISDFFQSMDARLRTEARKAKTLNDFGDIASEEIRVKLRSIIYDELLQAEARASLTPDERRGFLYWIQSLQSDYVSQHYHSQSLAEQTLAEGQGGSLEKWTKDREQRELVLYQVRQQIVKNVYVPFREVEQYYDRKYEEFNPPPKRQFRVITIDKESKADIEGIKKELDGGAAFAEIATRPINLFRAKDGGLFIPEPPAPSKPGDKSPPKEQAYFANPALNSAAKALKPGTWAGPIETGSTVAFVAYEELSQPSTSLYDAQVAIEMKLRSVKIDERMNKYIGDLLKRASVDDIDKMRLMLLATAFERYWAPLHPAEGG